MTIPESVKDDLADLEVSYADSLVSRTLGWMGRLDVSGDALVFEFDQVGECRIHMLFVFTPIRVVWCRDGEVVKDEILRPWVGYESAIADTVIELPVASDSTKKT